MFTVKAVTFSDKRQGENDIVQLWQCESVVVEPSVREPEGRNVGCYPTHQPPELHVKLLDHDRVEFHSFSIGRGIWHFNEAYVMNDRGRTIQKIEPTSAPLQQVEIQGARVA